MVEVGCGPGHVTAYLAAAGADATGIDLTPEMVEQARLRFPDGHYEVGDLRRLMRPTNAEGWVPCWRGTPLIHLAPLRAAWRDRLAGAAPGPGRLAAAGDALPVTTSAHNPTWFDHEIDLDFVFNEPAEVVGLVERAGLQDVEWYHRGPITARGEKTERLYVVARKP